VRETQETSDLIKHDFAR